MSPSRHPSAATLISYASGQLHAAGRAVVATHLSRCHECRADVNAAECLGGVLLEDLPPAELRADAVARALRRLDEAPSVIETGSLPVPRLSWIGPGVRHGKVLVGRDSVLRMLRVSPGRALPRHRHRGTELTCVLEGAFADETGTYEAGDVAEQEAEDAHQPRALGPSDCVCLIATTGQLRFTGFLTWLLEPFT